MFQPIGMSSSGVVARVRDRRLRDKERGRRAADAVIANGGSALEAATAQIDATFGRAARINSLKMSVERFIWLGANHRAVKARFGARVAMLADCLSIEAACSRVERWYRAEHRAFQIANAFGRGSRLQIDVLRELRLLLRLARGRLTDRQFQAIVDEVARL